MQRTRIKFCGITRATDALLAGSLGVDAFGFIFYPPSPRYISPEKAASIVSRLPPMITTVGVFMDAAPEVVAQTLEITPLSLLQFHGSESEVDCARWGRPYIKTIRVRAESNLAAQADCHQKACGFLLDTYLPDQVGGTGRTFDWSLLSPISRPVVLAGGLNADNVKAAITTLSPYAVDVSTGIEQLPGIKDEHLMRSFVQAVQSV